MTDVWWSPIARRFTHRRHGGRALLRDVGACTVLPICVACASPGRPATVTPATRAPDAAPTATRPGADTLARSVVAPARDTGIQLYGAEEQRLEAARNRAHMELMEMNARIYAERRARYLAAHCPPPDVLSGRQPSRRRLDRAPLDSARGKIILCGPEDHPLVTLVRRRGRSIALTGDREPIALMSGLDVTVFGTASSGGLQRWPRLEVRRVRVREYAGRPAHDGILRREPDGDYLELADGRRLRIPVLPTLLGPANGLRVWMVGPPSDSKTGEVLVPWRDELYRRRPENDSTTVPRRSP